MPEPVPANVRAATLPAPVARPAASTQRVSIRPLWLEALPLVVFAICTVVLFRDGLFGDTVFYERDTELFYQPLVRWYADQIHAGHLPFWIPLIFGGYPLFADGELGMLYPFTVFLVPILSADAFLTVSRALHLFLASAFMYVFMRVLGVGRAGGLLGGLVFAFGSFFVTQIQHENVVRSAVWLPLVLLCVEMALRSGAWRRQQWLVAAGLALAMAALGVHIQPVFMTLLCLGLFVLYRLVVGPVAGRRWERPLLLVWAPGLVTAIGLGVAAAQWLPLFELGRMSYRGPGLGYDLASTWPLRWQNLATIVLPYLFRLPDGRWITLWQQWESFLYVGIMPLGLAIVGAVVARRRIVPFFLLLTVFALLVGLADQSPIVNIHRLLWELPGFSSLRAPGRYAYLIVFGFAGLAAFGLDALVQQRRRSRLTILAALVVAAGAAGTIYLMLGLERRLLADPVRWKELIDQFYINTRHEHEWLTGPMVYQQLVDGLSLSDTKALLSVCLLAVCAVVLLAWALLPRLAGVWCVVALLLTAGDLLTFDYDYHPRASVASLLAPPPVTQFLSTLGPDARTFADGSLGFLEPNRLLYGDVPTIAGYSSLGTQRHFEYWSAVDSQEDALLDLWSTKYVVMADPPTDVVIANGTAYRPYNALFDGAAFNRTGVASFTIEPFRTTQVRVLSTLNDGVQIEQDTPVAEVTLVGTDGSRRALQLRAGIDTAENAYDRPDVQPYLHHARPTVAGTIPDFDPSGQPARANLYMGIFDVDATDVVSVEIRQIYPLGQTRVFGVGLADSGGTVRSIFSTDRTKLHRVWQENGIGVYQNDHAFPRAYVVPEVIGRTRSDDSALVRIAARPFDAGRQAVVEDGPLEGLPLVTPRLGQPVETGIPPRAASIQDISSDEVRVEVPDGPAGMLVLTDLYHRGWRATVDGSPSPVYLANFLFRGVYLPPGPHTIDFAFDPLSLRIGLAASVATLLFAVVVGVVLPLLLGRQTRR
jgi:hypothetical protein